MSVRSKHTSKIYTATVLLCSVYILHLLVFEGLMFANRINHNGICNIQDSLSKNHAHHTNSDYRLQLKHDDVSQRITLDPTIIQTDVIKILTEVLAVNPKQSCFAISLFRLPDCTFKLYRLIRVYLI